jgi:hypothetical protein
VAGGDFEQSQGGTGGRAATIFPTHHTRGANARKCRENRLARIPHLSPILMMRPVDCGRLKSPSAVRGEIFRRGASMAASRMLPAWNSSSPGEAGTPGFPGAGMSRWRIPRAIFFKFRGHHSRAWRHSRGMLSKCRRFRVTSGLSKATATEAIQRSF